MGTSEDIRRSIQDCPDVMDGLEVSKALHINRKTCYKLIRQGIIPAARIGRVYRLQKENVIAYLNSRGEQQNENTFE